MIPSFETREPATPAERYFALDVLRGAMMWLGVVLHASVSYMTVRVPDLLWAVQDRSRSPFFDWLFWWIHGFRMPVFFFLGGFFAAKLYTARGPRGFLLNRTQRILGPFVVGSVILLPVIFYVWAYGWLISGRCTVREILRVQFSADIQRNLYGPAHLWFLEYLFLFCVALWGVQCLRGVYRPAAARRPSRFDRLMLSAWRPLYFAVPSALILWVDVGVVINFHNSFVPGPSQLLYYGLFFAAGVSYFRFRHIRERFLLHGWMYLVPSLPLFAIVGWLLQQQLTQPLTGPARLGLGASVALFAWLSVFGYLGLALRFFNRPQPAVRYLSDASYWIYLCHFPVVGFLQVSLFHLAVPAGVKVLLVIVATTAFGLLSYQSAVRYTFIGAFLNGRRQRSTTLQRVPTERLAPIPRKGRSVWHRAPAGQRASGTADLESWLSSLRARLEELLRANRFIRVRKE